jgi:hypothetical protein
MSVLDNLSSLCLFSALLMQFHSVSIVAWRLFTSRLLPHYLYNVFRRYKIILRYILWLVDPLLGKDLETNDEITAVPMQWLRRRTIHNDRLWATARQIRSRGKEYTYNNRFTVEIGYFLRGPCREVMSRTVWSNQFSWALREGPRRGGTMVVSCQLKVSLWRED